jgi:peptidoglycan/xylan/chitin deacetylase (PgdA/CDA1 family)
MPSKNLGRALASAAFRASGIPRLIRATYARRRVTVLLYHDPRRETIERHLEYLVARYTPVTIDEVSRALGGGSWSDLPPRPLLVTIDDGHRGNAALSDAFERFGVRPVIFVCSQVVGTQRRFWFDQPGAEPERFEWAHAERLASLERTVGFRREREYGPGGGQALSSDQIARLGKSVDFGSHTRFHPILTSIPAEQSEDEIRASKEEVARMTDRPCRHFAYPAGQYGPLEVEFARRAGYKTARTCDFGFVGPRSDPLRLPLTAMVFDESVDSLAAKVGGAVYLRCLARRRPSGRATVAVPRPPGRAGSIR